MLAFSLVSIVLYGEVRVWEKSEEQSFEPGKREGWKPWGKKVISSGEVVVENEKLFVVVQLKTGDIAMWTKGKGSIRTWINLVPLGKDGQKRTVNGVEVLNMEADEATIRLRGVEMEIVAGTGKPFVTVRPGNGVETLEVDARARYALLPDFFGYDVVYDAKRFSSSELNIPAENFLILLLEGNHAMVMCIWPGSLLDTKASSAHNSMEVRTEREPLVQIRMEGSGEARRVIGTKIEFLNKPIYVAIMEHEHIWHDEPINTFPVQEPVKVGWRRPFDARWRANMIIAEGKKSIDLLSRSQSYNFLYPPSEPVKSQEWTELTWKDGEPWVHEERLWGYRYPAWFSGEDTYVAVFMDDPKRKQRYEENERQKAEKAKREGKEYTPVPAVFENIYERALFYPLDRNEKTPLDVYTPADIMAQALGRGPCEYIVDIEGIAPRSGSGKEGRPLLAPSSCLLWSKHVFPMLCKAKPLKEDDKKHLIQAVQDLSVFLHAVYDRIEEYRAFNENLLNLCAKATPGSTGIVANVRQLALEMQKKLMGGASSSQLEKFRKQLEEWDAKIKGILQDIETDNYASANCLGQIRNLGEAQDITVADCRRYTKAIQQEVALVETVDPESAVFAAEVRRMCRNVLRRGHPRELLQSDRGR